MPSKEPEQLHIKWNNYTNVTHSVFRKLLAEDRLTDITLACDGGNIKCHRIVLAGCSPYFENLFNSYTDDKHIVFFMKDIKKWTLQSLVQFMYHGEIRIDEVQLPILMEAADGLRIRGLSLGASEGLDGVESDVERASEDEDGWEYAEEEGEFNANPDETFDQGPHMRTEFGHPGGISDRGPRQLPNLRLKHRISAGSGQPRSLLRPHVPPSQSGSRPRKLMGIQASEAPVAKKRILLPSQPPQGLPKLNKITRLDKQEVNGNGDVSPTMVKSQASSSNPGGKFQNTRTRFQKVESVMDIDSEDEDGFPHETEQDDDSLRDDSQAGESPSTMLHFNEDDSGSEVEETYLAPGGRRMANPYPEEVRDTVLSNLKSGMSVMDCTGATGINRKTIARWRNQSLQDSSRQEEGGEVVTQSVVQRTPVMKLPPRPVGPVVDAADRAERLKSATVLTQQGITVRQAALHYIIPRTTLCAYMKREGITAKKSIPSPNSTFRHYPPNSNKSSTFGLVDMVDVNGDQDEDDGGEGHEQEFEYDDQEQYEGGVDAPRPSLTTSRLSPDKSLAPPVLLFGGLVPSTFRQSSGISVEGPSSTNLLDIDSSKGAVSLPPGVQPKKIRLIRKHHFKILKKAAVSVLKGMTFQKVSEVYDVPKTTLRDYMIRQGLLQRESGRDDKKYQIATDFPTDSLDLDVK